MTLNRRFSFRPRRAAAAPDGPARLFLTALVAAVLCASAQDGFAAPATAPGTQPARPIRVHGNDDRFWIVQSYSVTGDKGISDEAMVYRRASGEERWRPVGKLDSDVIALGSRLTQLAILLPDGSWQLLSDETRTSGPALPNDARLVTFGADGGTLWAVGQLTPATAPTSKPAAPAATGRAPTTVTAATAPSAADAPRAAAGPATAPSGAAAAPSGATLALFSLQSHGWVRGADLPPGAQGSATLLSLSFVDHEPIVAWRSAPQSVEVWRFTAGNWWPAGEVAMDAGIVRLKLVDGTPVPVLWVAAGEQESVLSWFGRDAQKRVAVPVAADTRAEDHAVAFANGRVRVVGYVDGKLTERTYDPLTGAAAGDPAPLVLPKPASPTFARWVEPLITLALIYVIVASVRRRQQMRDVALNPTEFVLAPVGRRFLAGTIDAVPVLVAGAVSWWQYSRGSDTAIGESWLTALGNMAPAQIAIFGGGCAVYLLHTSLAEILAGRSLGKACCGLRVVGLDGKPAAAAAVVIRNLLRIIDLAMVFFPLVLILFSPLRQRAGDVAAGTLVVMAGKTQPADPGTAADDAPGVAGRSSSQSDT